MCCSVQVEILRSFYCNLEPYSPINTP